MLVLGKAIVHNSDLVRVGGRALCKLTDSYSGARRLAVTAGLSIGSAAFIPHTLVLLPPTSNNNLALVPR
jgi:hypothetical protein